MSPAEHAEVEGFLLREARLLDGGRLEEWLKLLTEDIHYWMPGQPALYRRNAAQFSPAKRNALYDDDMVMLKRRVARAMHPTAWSEDPPTRMLRQVSNIEVEPAEQPGECKVYSAVVLWRSRNEREQNVLFARREDVLRRVDGALKLARRHVQIGDNILMAKNLNVFI